MRKPDPEKIVTSIYDYLDFRKFLQDLYREFKSKKPNFNLKRFTEKGGIKSQGLLKMVIDGDRRLTPDTLTAFCQAFEIKGREKLFFETLVQYNQADDPDKKREAFEVLSDLRPRARKFTLEKRHYQYLTRDYYVTIREMVNLNDFKEDPDWIAARCAPPITAHEAKEAIATLLQLGLLKRDENGKLIQSQSFVRTVDHNTQAMEAYHFHDAVLNKARHSLSYLEQDKRSYQALTLTMPRTMVNDVINEYIRLRDWIVEKANQTPVCDEVYQVNFQLFPATWKNKEDK